MPKAWAAIPIRPPSRVAIAIVKPLCSSPRRLSFGLRTLSKPRVTVSLARIPILVSFFRTENPFDAARRVKGETPWFLAARGAYGRVDLAAGGVVGEVFLARRAPRSPFRLSG